MSGALLWALQVALVDRLKADAGMEALVGDRIFDGMAPEGTEFPYVRVSSKTEVPNDTFGNEGAEVTITLDIFSKPLLTLGIDTEMEAVAVLGAQNKALAVPLNVEGYGSVRLKREFATTLLEDNGTTRHIPARYRAVALET